MAKSLIEELPRIASEGRQEAQRIIERLSSGTRIGLQTNELVLPRKDVSGFFRGQVPNIPNAFNAALDGDKANLGLHQDQPLTRQNAETWTCPLIQRSKVFGLTYAS